MGMMDLRRQIIAGGKRSELPAGFRELSYITANGNQSLRLNYTPVQGDEIHCKFTIGDGVSSTHGLFSAGTDTYQFLLLTGFSNTGFYYKYFSSATVEVKANLSKNTWYDADINSGGVLSLNGGTWTRAYTNALDGANTTLWLFQRHDGGSKWFGSISEFWITNGGEYKVKLIPCLRKSDSKAGMYDTVSKTFYGSSLNDFIAGT